MRRLVYIFAAHSLFLKIFLWFWLAMVFIVLAYYAVTLARLNDETRQRWMSDQLATHARTSARTFERNGQAGLVEYLNLMEQTLAIRAFLFDQNGNELSGRVTPPEARQLGRLAVAGGDASDSGEITSASSFVAKSTVAPSGRRYVMVGELPGWRRFPYSYDFGLRDWQWQLLVLFLTAGVLCYALARYLVSPVVKLRAATYQLARGNLSTRVGPSLGRRHDELADLGRDFDRMAEQLESLALAQRRLLQDISHELRSPLARLFIAIELTRRQVPDGASPALARMEAEAERLNNLIGKLLTLEQLESPGEIHPRSSVDLAALVSKIASDADFEAKGQNRSVVVTASEPCTIEGDEELIGSAIENTLRNAVRYTDEGTTVEVSLRCLRQNGDNTKSTALLRVRDHGCGVPTEQLGEIFRPFYRVAAARDRQSGGTGLGLAITQRAVTLHGGSVSAWNAPDRGLIVELQLPVSSS